MTPRVVCFDLGNVAVKIARSWTEAVELAGHKPLETDKNFNDTPLFDAFQVGAMSESDYLSALASTFNEDTAWARKTHDAVLVSEFPELENLVASLKADGILTGCLSNTNALHWKAMTDPAQYPTVAAFEFPIASHIVRAGKPDEAIYRAFEDLSGFRGEDIVYFDDVREYVLAGSTRGWRSFQVSLNSNPVDQMKRTLTELGLLETQ